VRSNGTSWTIVEGIDHDEFGRAKLDATIAELVEERDEVRDLLGS
jgi:malate dehydrogenase